jgi:hypothetical protein
VKAIVLAPSTTPSEVIAALRARVFVCISAPFDAEQIAGLACKAAGDSDWRTDIEVLSAHPDWVSLRANCRMLTAERVVTFLRELHSKVADPARKPMSLQTKQPFHDLATKNKPSHANHLTNDIYSLRRKLVGAKPRPRKATTLHRLRRHPTKDRS